MIGRSKLLIKLQKMGHKAEDVHSEDNMDNSFDESASEVSYGDEEDENIDEAEKEKRRKKKAAKKKKKRKIKGFG